jgi:hypothetical protein
MFCFVLCAVRVVLKESRRLVLPKTFLAFPVSLATYTVPATRTATRTRTKITSVVTSSIRSCALLRRVNFASGPAEVYNTHAHELPLFQYLFLLVRPRHSRWLPTAAPRVRALVWQVGFLVDKVALWQDFSEYFGFPANHHLFHQILHPHNHPGSVQ